MSMQDSKIQKVTFLVVNTDVSGRVKAIDEVF